jgi:serine/threonine-protein kinase
MGEVWRARDTKLDRDIAIKVLPEQFARDSQRLARLQREARLLAAISHPSIAVLYDLEQADEATFLALELVEGETLAERLIRGPIPMGDALPLALQIAEALEAAHERGVIHRDLKPANIKITPNGKIKVLDFGLAKAFDVMGRDGGESSSPAPTVTGTAQGAILGTPAYMAPEQARGEPVDARADVWAFGCVLFEMLTGERVFDGDTMSDVLASVLKVDPGWSRLPENLHPRIRHLLERCLEKRRRDRFAGISDARVELERALADPRGLLAAPAAESPEAGRRRSVRFAAAALGAVLLAAITTALSVWQLKPAPPAQVMHFVDDLPFGPPAEMLSFATLDVSRDGTQVAYLAGAAMTRQQLYLRDLRAIDDAGARPVQGAAGLIGQPRFSPDGRWIAYFTPSQIVRVPIGGGTPQIVAAVPVPPIRGLHWDDRGLVYAVADGIYEAPAAGGEARLLLPSRDGEYFAASQRLPGRDAVLFSVAAGTRPSDWEAGDVVVHSFESGERTVVARRARDARYLKSGHVVYAQGTQLYAVPFDLDRLAVTGAPVRVVDGIVRAEEGQADSAQYAVSDVGSLVYLESAVARTVARRSLMWVSRTGEREPIGLPAGDYSMARLSPDGRHIALVVGRIAEMRSPDLLILDLETGNPRQLTLGRVADAPVWSLDSKRLYFRSSPTGVSSVYSIAADGGEPELVASPAPPFTTPFPWSLTPDGQTLLAVDVSGGERRGIVALGLGAERGIRIVLPNAIFPAPSPAGPWLAWTEPDGTAFKINVSSYPDVARQTYPVAAGNHPVFSRDGRELYFVEGDAVRAVSIEYEPTFRIVGAPRDVFRGAYPFGLEGRTWDAHPDGQRFLVLLDAEDGNAASLPRERQRIHIVLNWGQELERQLAAEQ